MSKHTPGPWVESGETWEGDGAGGVLIKSQSGETVAFATSWSPDRAQPSDFYNAKLIASAPQLFDACTEACEVLEVLRRGHGIEVGAACYPALNMLREVLDKLRGDE